MPEAFGILEPATDAEAADDDSGADVASDVGWAVPLG
jgi:hypothetical protein